MMAQFCPLWHSLLPPPPPSWSTEDSHASTFSWAEKASDQQQGSSRPDNPNIIWWMQLWKSGNATANSDMQVYWFIRYKRAISRHVLLRYTFLSPSDFHSTTLGFSVTCFYNTIKNRANAHMTHIQNRKLTSFSLPLFTLKQFTNHSQRVSKMVGTGQVSGTS